MNIVLLVGFEEREVVGGDLLMLKKKYGEDGSIVLKSIYPKSQDDHTAFCKEAGVVAVLFLENRFYVVPNAAARLAAPHILFSTKSGSRTLCEYAGIEIRLRAIMTKEQLTA